MKARLVLKLYIHNSMNDSEKKGGGEGRGGEEQGGEGVREGEQGGIRKEEEEEKQQLFEPSHQGAIPTDQACIMRLALFSALLSNRDFPSLVKSLSQIPPD